jgi:uncharacterized protein (TIGR03067 family)
LIQEDAVKSLMSLMLAFVACVLVVADDKKDDKKDDAQKKVQGKWEMVRGEQEGNAFPEDFVKAFKLTFDGDKYEAKLPDGGSEAGKFKLKADDKPGTATFTTDAGEVRNGIFKFDGEELHLCVSHQGGDKPKEFAGKDGALFIVLKKAK